MFTVGALIVAIILMAGHNEDAFQNIRVASLTVVSYIETPLSVIRVYRTALQTNTELERKNIILQDEVSRLRTLRDENEALRSLLGMKHTSEHGLLPVRIVTKNLTGINNYMVVNAGSGQGVKTGMPVVNSDGLIGMITITGENHSRVMPLFNLQFRTSAIVENTRAYGIVSWEAGRLNELVLRYVPQTIEVSEGQIVQTSGLSNQFPPYIPIGEVIRFEPEPGKETQVIYLRPFANLYSVTEAHIKLFTPEPEIGQLHQADRRLQGR